MGKGSDKRQAIHSQMHTDPPSHPPPFGAVFVAKVEVGPYTWNPCWKHWRFATSLEKHVKNRRKACIAAGNLHHLCTGSFSFKNSSEREFYNYIYILCPLSRDRKLERLNFHHSFPEVKTTLHSRRCRFWVFFPPFAFSFFRNSTVFRVGWKIKWPSQVEPANLTVATGHSGICLSLIQSASPSTKVNLFG